MTSLHLSLFCIPLLAACGGAAHPAPATAGDGAGAQRGGDRGRGAWPGAEVESGAQAEARVAPGAPAGSAYRSATPSMDLDAEAGALLPRDERPGLATHWGEARRSPTRSVSFLRLDPSAPTDVAMFAYDDDDGVAAMTGRFPGETRAAVPLAGGALTVSLEDASGRPLPAVGYRGRLVAAGEPGARYQIRVDNHTARRFEVVATVDGLDVIDGGDGDPEKRGYLVDAWATVEIDGFRQTEDEVAAFRFGDVSGSYAQARGRGRDIGVIGVAAFAERGDAYGVRRDPREVELRRTADPFPGHFAPPPRSLVR